MAISNVSSSQLAAKGAAEAMSQAAARSAAASSPLTPKTFDGLDSMETYLRDIGKKATEKYQAEFEKDGNKEMTVDELKDMLKKRFSGYTLTDTEPTDTVKGKNLLYIDDTNLKKMATDADYRAKVMGLMDREYAGTAPTTFKLDVGDFKTWTTGSVFSISEKNPVEDGIPYVGMASQDSFMETGPRDAPLPTDFLSKTRTSKSSTAKIGSADWLKEMIEKRRAEIKDAEKKAAAEEAQKKASEERAANNGVDIIV